MAETRSIKSFSSELLALDSTNSDPLYRKYREQLAQALVAAKRRERIAYWMCAITGPLSFALMFIGGSKVFGSFDPWDKTATPLSMTLAVICVVASIVFWVLLASFYSRFLPGTRAAEDSLRDSHLLQIAAQLASLQKEVAALKLAAPPHQRP